MTLLQIQLPFFILFFLATLFIIFFFRKYLSDFIKNVLIEKDNLKRSDFRFWLTILPTVLFLIVPATFFTLGYFGYIIDNESNGVSMKYYYFITTLVTVSNVIVVSNTIGFMSDCNETLILVDCNNPDKRVQARDISKKLVRDYIITITLSIIIVTLFINNIVLHYYFSNEYPWGTIFRYNEYITLGIFFIFYRIDRNLFKVISELTIGVVKSSTDKNEMRLLNLHDLARRALIYVDFAGFLGVGFILLTSEIFHFSETEADHKQLQGLFVYGLSSGAIAMHVIFTQINYNFLKTKYESREKEIESI